MKNLRFQVASVAVLAVIFLLAVDPVQASERYWRVSPSYLAPAPFTYGEVVSPPPYLIYDPAPAVYFVPAQPGPLEVEVVPVSSRYRYRFDYGYDLRYSLRHGRYNYKVDVRDSYGGRVRYRYRFNRGRVRARLKRRR